MNTVDQDWLRLAAVQVEEKTRIKAEVDACEGMPPEGKLCADNLLKMCQLLLERAVLQYLRAL